MKIKYFQVSLMTRLNYDSYKQVFFGTGSHDRINSNNKEFYVLSMELDIEIFCY